MVLGPGVEAVEQALVAAVPALGHQPGHDRAGAEVDVLGVAGEAERHRAAGLGVDADELDAVGPGADAVLAGVRRRAAARCSGRCRRLDGVLALEQRVEGVAARRRRCSRRTRGCRARAASSAAVSPVSQRRVVMTRPLGRPSRQASTNSTAQSAAKPNRAHCTMVRNQRAAEQPEHGRAADQEQEADEDAGPQQTGPDPQGHTAEAAVPGDELGAAGKDERHQHEGEGAPPAQPRTERLGVPERPRPATGDVHGRDDLVIRRVGESLHGRSVSGTSGLIPLIPGTLRVSSRSGHFGPAAASRGSCPHDPSRDPP